MRVLLPLAGAAILLLLITDVFLTVFHSQGRGGPLNRRLAHLLWGGLRRVGRRGDGSARGQLLSYGGPLLVVAALTVWASLLIGGFALIVYPWVESFLVSPGHLREPWLEALYYSGYVASTLGLGDVIADAEALRLITVVEAAGGFALFSVSITYFLSVYRELIAMQSLASDISALFHNGEEAVVEFARAEGYASLARWSEQLSGNLSRVRMAHHQYPVLHYFRVSKADLALPVQLGALLRLRRLVTPEDASPPIATLARHPSFLALMDSLEHYLDDVDRYFVPQGVLGGEDAAEDTLQRKHQRLLRYMVYD